MYQKVCGFSGGSKNITFDGHIVNITDMLTDALFWYGNHRSDSDITYDSHIVNITDMLTDTLFWYGNHR